MNWLFSRPGNELLEKGFISDAGLPMSRLELGKEAVALLTLYEEEVESIAIVDTLRSLLFNL